ncbi:amino acid ABC transporter permease, partial [Pseudomonas syringae pv. tagetis]
MTSDFDLSAILQGGYAGLIDKGIEKKVQLSFVAWFMAMAVALLLV